MLVCSRGGRGLPATAAPTLGPIAMAHVRPQGGGAGGHGRPRRARGTPGARPRRHLLLEHRPRPGKLDSQFGAAGLLVTGGSFHNFVCFQQELPGYLSQVRWQVTSWSDGRDKGVPSDQLLEMARTAELMLRTRYVTQAERDMDLEDPCAVSEWRFRLLQRGAVQLAHRAPRRRPAQPAVRAAQRREARPRARRRRGERGRCGADHASPGEGRQAQRRNGLHHPHNLTARNPAIACSWTLVVVHVDRADTRLDQRSARDASAPPASRAADQLQTAYYEHRLPQETRIY